MNVDFVDDFHSHATFKELFVTRFKRSLWLKMFINISKSINQKEMYTKLWGFKKYITDKICEINPKTKITLTDI